MIKFTNTQVQSGDTKPGTSVDPSSYSFLVCVFESDILDETVLLTHSHYGKLFTSVSALFFAFENVQFTLRYCSCDLKIDMSHSAGNDAPLGHQEKHGNLINGQKFNHTRERIMICFFEILKNPAISPLNAQRRYIFCQWGCPKTRIDGN